MKRKEPLRHLRGRFLTLSAYIFGMRIILTNFATYEIDLKMSPI